MADVKTIFPIVLQAAREMGVSDFHAMIIYSQGQQESGYSSNVFVKNNNAFGMKFPAKRKSPFIAGKGTAAPAGESFPGDPNNYYAKFNSLADSVKDLIHRQNYFGIKWENIKSAEDYIDFCRQTKYFQGSPAIYKSNVTSLLKQFKDYVKTNPGTSLGTAAAILFFLF
jgi:hypothetical protein